MTLLSADFSRRGMELFYLNRDLKEDKKVKRRENRIWRAIFISNILNPVKVYTGYSPKKKKVGVILQFPTM